MEALLTAAFDNAVLVSLLAVVVLVVDRVAWRPAMSHWLWVLLLIKLMTPPLVSVRMALPGVVRLERRDPFPDGPPTGRAEPLQPGLSANAMAEQLAAAEAPETGTRLELFTGCAPVSSPRSSSETRPRRGALVSSCFAYMP